MKKLLLSGVMALVMVLSFQPRVDAGVVDTCQRICASTTIGLAGSYMLWVQAMGGLSYAEAFLKLKLNALTGATLLSVPLSLTCTDFSGTVLRGESCYNFLSNVLHNAIPAGYVLCSTWVVGFAAYIALRCAQNRIAK